MDECMMTGRRPEQQVRPPVDQNPFPGDCTCCPMPAISVANKAEAENYKFKA